MYSGEEYSMVITVLNSKNMNEFMNTMKSHPDTLLNAMKTVINSVCVMTGAFPLVYVFSKLMKKPLKMFGKKIGINNVSAMGFMSSLVTNVTTFALMKDMDKKGMILNAAFSVSASFALASHLAMALIYNSELVLSVIIAKISAGLLAVIVACMIYKNSDKESN